MGEVLIRIREVSTGKEVDRLEEVDEKYLDNEGFYYEEGNGSCDCNRKLMFGYAQGVEFSDEETPCGESAYKVRVTVNGNVVLDELK